MANIYKCRFCGEDMEIFEENTICTCQTCYNTQTIPSYEEIKMNLFARANRFKDAGDFDRARRMFEDLSIEYPYEAEAYWGILLCKYGILYRKNPRNQRISPVLNRLSYERIVDSKEFARTIDTCPEENRSIYLEEANIFDELRENGLYIASNESPYDVFISCLERDTYGNKTEDSFFAEKIYERLTELGYRAFYAGEALAEKQDAMREPCIFAAMTSATVMILVGTSAENIDSPIVRNEWVRYREIRSSRTEKKLILCYKDMVLDDLPRGLNGVRSLDLSNPRVYGDIKTELEIAMPERGIPGGMSSGGMSSGGMSSGGMSSGGMSSGGMIPERVTPGQLMPEKLRIVADTNIYNGNAEPAAAVTPIFASQSQPIPPQIAVKRKKTPFAAIIIPIVLVIIGLAVGGFFLARPYMVRRIELTKPQNQFLAHGQTVNVGYEISPDFATEGTVTWNSSDENVVKVYDGNIKAIGDGSCMVTVTTQNGTSNYYNVVVSDLFATWKYGGLYFDDEIYEADERFALMMKADVEVQEMNFYMLFDSENIADIYGTWMFLGETIDGTMEYYVAGNDGPLTIYVDENMMYVFISDEIAYIYVKD